MVESFRIITRTVSLIRVNAALKKDTFNSCNLLPQEALRIEGRSISSKKRYQTFSPLEAAGN